MPTHMNNQEAFDHVIKHLTTQPRAKEGLRCVYRTDDGRKCAIGCFIPDDKYDSDFEGRNVRQLMQSGPSKEFFRSLFRGVSPPLLHMLQNLHDTDFFFKSYTDFRMQAYALAEAFELSPASVPYRATKEWLKHYEA